MGLKLRPMAATFSQFASSEASQVTLKETDTEGRLPERRSRYTMR
jgi:hypothetical protein